MTRKILIVGSGSQARYIIDNLSPQHLSSVIGIADLEDKKNVGRRLNGVPIICLASDVFTRYTPDTCSVIIACGDTKRKEEWAVRFRKHHFEFVSAISSAAYISPTAHVGTGCIINAGAIIMPNARVGDHVILHATTVVEHDNVIEDFTNLAPGVTLAGRVTIGKGATLYTGAIVIPDISVGAWAVVAAGAVVIRDVPAKARVAGIPAQPLRHKKK
jgi:sugar O-acyltransferase (sialic acid O-acetyltransferase NeuD family)